MKREIVVLCGSESDLGQISSGLAVLRVAEMQGLVEVLAVEVCSTHRNPAELRVLLRKFADCAVDVVVVCAGKLAALFGDADSISRNELGNSHTRFIAVPLKGKSTEASHAAYLSAKEVPGSQFIFMEEFFNNPETAFVYAVEGGLPKITLGEQKPSQSFSLEEARKQGRRKYPKKASYDDVVDSLEFGGFVHVYTGKTRETFVNPEDPELLYILATDRISIFDVVLAARIPDKGAILTAMTVHWLENVFFDVPHHLVASGIDILRYLPSRVLSYTCDNADLVFLMKNMIVVKRVEVLKVEAIVRGYLTGSGLRDYQETGKVCGMRLLEGLVDGDELPKVLFTPSTKADYGQHDQNIGFEEAVEIIGREEARFIRNTSLRLYGSAREKLCSSGIILADTKFEFGVDSMGNIILIDEVLTPDSSRFWPEEGRKIAMAEGKTPPSFDKERIRIAGKEAGIKTTNPGWVPSEDLIAQTVQNYRYMMELVTGKTLEQFWRDNMEIPE